VKVIDAHYTFGRDQLILRISSADDSDMRAEIAEFEKLLKTRVFLQKINPRDAAIMLGGLGECGRAFCCCTMKNCVGNVNVRMARAQSSNANPGAMHGACGRLRCCLRYEHDHYQRALQMLPERGAIVQTPAGRGRVRDHRLLQESVLVAIEGGRTLCFHAREITLIEKGQHVEQNVPPDERPEP
jgi:cell fate regulator YaaT (PSP1 superfamily)